MVRSIPIKARACERASRKFIPLIRCVEERTFVCFNMRMSQNLID